MLYTKVSKEFLKVNNTPKPIHYQKLRNKIRESYGNNIISIQMGLYSPNKKEISATVTYKSVEK